MALYLAAALRLRPLQRQALHPASGSSTLAASSTRTSPTHNAHNALYRVAVTLADYPAFKARFRELDADKFDELSQAAEL